MLDMMEQRESLDSKLQSVATRRGDLDAEREKLEGAHSLESPKSALSTPHSALE